MEENTDGDSAPEITSLFAYDAQGHVRIKQVSIEGLSGAKTLRYEYDLAGRLTRLIYPDSTDIRTTYDSAGGLAQVSDASGNAYASYTYTPAGNVATHTLGSGLLTGSYTYTLRDWLQKANYAGVFLDTLTYDFVGNITSQVYRHGTGANTTAVYGYDALHPCLPAGRALPPSRPALPAEATPTTATATS